MPLEPSAELMVHFHKHVSKDDTPISVHDLYSTHGAYSSLLRGNMGVTEIAVKVWRGAPFSMDSRQNFAKKLSRELDIWKSVLSHPNIASFICVASGYGPLPSIVMPYYTNGNINDYIAKNPSADILGMLNGITSALSYMHNSNPPLIHGKLKGTNILINDAGVALLSDIAINSMAYFTDLTVYGTEIDESRWLAPEVVDPGLQTNPNEELGFVTLESDVYSFAMTAIEVYSGRVPYAHRRFIAGVISDVMNDIKPPRPTCESLSDGMWDLIQCCWKQKPQDRPSMSTVSAWVQLLYQMQQVKSYNLL